MIIGSIQTRADGVGLGVQEPRCGAGETDEVRRAIVGEFLKMMSMSSDDGLYWTGTISDLVELTHIVWESGMMIDDSGRPMAFAKMVHHIFNILHVREPKRPTAVMNNVNSRKNVRTVPLITRYRLLMESRRGCGLLGNCVRRQEKRAAE